MFLEKEWTCACTPWFDLYKWAKLHDMNNPNSSKVCSSKYLMSKFTCFCFHLSRMVFFKYFYIGLVHFMYRTKGRTKLFEFIVDEAAFSPCIRSDLLAAEFPAVRSV